MKQQYYITFGQGHLHRIANKILNHDSVGVICAKSEKEAKKIVLMVFGEDFAGIRKTKPNMADFPRKLIKL